MNGVRSRRWPRAVVVLAAALLLSGCGERRIEAEPPLPPLEALETAVSAKLTQTRAQAIADGSVASWTRYAKTLQAHALTGEALDVYVVAIDHAKDDAQRFELLYLAGLGASRRDPERALAFFDRAAEIDGSYVPLHLRAGALHESAERWAEARRHFAKAVELCESRRLRDSRTNPASHAFLGLGRVALGEGKTDEAIALLERARSEDTENEDVHSALAIAYTRAGRRQDAAQAATMVGNLESSRGFADPIAQSMSQEGVSFTSLQQFGVAALRGHEFEKALEAFEHALELRPGDLDGLLNKAQALVGLGRFEEAGPNLDKVLASRPDDPIALAFRAGCSMSRGDLPGAVSYLRRALAVDPRLLDVRWNLARALRSLGQTAEARTHLESILERRPDRPEVRLELAHVLAAEGQKDRALEEVERVLVTHPANRKALALKDQLREAR